MMSVTHFSTTDETFEKRALDALTVLGSRPGFERGTLGRSTDDTTAWVLVTHWADVGSYRRALGNYDVKLTATPLLGEALDRPSSFESLVDAVAGGEPTTQASDREPEA